MIYLGLLVGLFCFLCLIGYVFTDDATAFATKAVIGLVGLAFGALLLFIGYLVFSQ